MANLWTLFPELSFIASTATRFVSSTDLTRLNRARQLLQDGDELPEVVTQLAQDAAISARQAYRYLQQFLRLIR